MAFVNLLQAIYPVGALYLSTTNISPATLVGGTWVAISNRYLKVSTTQTGGSNYITVGNLPKDMGRLQIRGGNTSTDIFIDIDQNNRSYGIVKSANLVDWSGSHASIDVTSRTNPQYQNILLGGDGNAFDVPYFGIYAWYRKA